MKILITGICGFVGASIARLLPLLLPDINIIGVDNLMRDGAHLNRAQLKKQKITVYHGDLRNPEDLEHLPLVDWVIDAAACPLVTAGIDDRVSSRQLLGHNLLGTINLLELCRQWGAGLTLLSTSRVYSIAGLIALPLTTANHRYIPHLPTSMPGLTSQGITEDFSTQPPLSLYGVSKRASELLALEYAAAFNFPLFINRCGVLAGAGQFAHAHQGIFAYWIHASREGRPLQFIGFNGAGHQVRDCLHPHDLTRLLALQIARPESAPKDNVPLNVSGGLANSASLAELDEWCRQRYKTAPATPCPDNRPFDVPWLVLDHTRAQRQWDWTPEYKLVAIMEEIADFADNHPDWLSQT